MKNLLTLAGKKEEKPNKLRNVKKQKARVFLAHLFALLVKNCLRFCLKALMSLLLGLTIGLAINGMKLIDKKFPLAYIDYSNKKN